MRIKELGIGIAVIAMAFFQISAAVKPFREMSADIEEPGTEESQKALTRETAAVFAWIKRNTPGDAIFLAPPYEAHRIMAFADRKVIASGKVYPSETKELAERLGDLSTFFFTTDVTDAERIADTYRVRYVLLPRNPRFLDFCEAGGGCFLATYRDRKGLTPDGKQKTLIGKLLYGDPPNAFAKIWDSPNFLVYRIVSRTRATGCELDDQEKLEATRFVHTLLGAPPTPPTPAGFDDMRCAIHLSLWSNGEILGEAVSSGSTFAKNLEAAAERLRDNLTSGIRSNAKNARIILAAWDETQLVPEDRGRLGRPIDSGRGYLFQTGAGSVFLFPFAYPVQTYAENTVATAFLQFCRQAANADSECGEKAITRFESFPIAAWIEEPSTGKINNLFGTIAGNPKPEVFDERTLRTGIRAALEGFMNEYRSGDLEKYYDPQSLFLIAQAFIAGSRIFDEPAYLAAAAHVASSGRTKLTVSGSSAPADYGYAVRAYLALWRASGRTEYLDIAGKFAEAIRGTQLSQNFSPDPRADAVTFLALADYARTAADQQTENAVRELAEPLKTRFLERRIQAAHAFSSAEPTVTDTAFLMQGFEFAGDREFADTLGMWLLESDDPTAVSSDTSATAVALSAAPATSGDAPLFKHALENALSRLLALQYTTDSAYFIAPSQIKNYLGMIRTSAQVMRFSASGTANFILAGARYLEMNGMNK